jgi:hypothetical protein
VEAVGLWFGPRLFTRVALGGVAGDMSQDVVLQSIADELLMNPLWQILRGEFEGAGEGRFSGHIAAALPAANAA